MAEDTKATLPLDEEKKKITDALNVEMAKDEIWYGISKKWWNSWASYVGVDPDDARGQKSGPGGQPRPSPIDNSDLVVEGTSHGELKKELTEGQTHVWIPEAAWKLIHEIYGGGPTLARKVVAVGLRSLRIEAYPQFLTVLVVDEETGEPKVGDKVISSWSLQQTPKDVVDAYAPKSTTGDREGRIWRQVPKEVKENPTEEDEDAAKKKAKTDSATTTTTTTTTTTDESSDKKPPELEWRLFRKEDCLQKFDSLELPSCVELLLDFKKEDGFWSKNAAGKKDWRDFAIGDIIDAKDTQNKWYESTIREVKEDKVYVHYNGWPSRWDEWMPKNSDRLAPKNTYTTGPYVPNSEGGGSSWTSYSSNEKGTPKVKGAVGLRNLGNTCFMNSTLQCLSNTPKLTEFFIENKHKSQLNKKNPLGWQGKVAEAYGSLLHDLWSGEYRVVAPRLFKETIGEFQPRFSGYQQHDSSELLSFLLDGIHEDCNRVMTKPATEAVDSKGRPDAEVAKEAWRRHLLRNQSVVVDMLQGQLKSRVVCPDCKKDSVTFDPFMFLSVPLPTSDYLIQDVTFVSTPDPEKPGSGVPRVVSVKASKHATIGQFKEALAKETGTSAEDLYLAEVWKNKIHQVFHPDYRANFGQMDDIWAWHLPKLNLRENKEKLWTEVILVNNYMTDSRHYRAYGFPTVMSLPTSKLQAFPIQELRDAIRTAIAPFLEGGAWNDGESDKGTYLLEVMDVRAFETRGEIVLADSGEVNLLKMAGAPMFAIGLFWTETTKNRLKVDFGTKGSSSEKSSSTIKLSDCIDSFVTEETLPKSEAWYCRNCKDHKMAQKKFDIWMAPDTLVIHLKRFSYDRMWRDKIDTYVDFPTEGLDLSKWIVSDDEKKDAIYDLYAVSNHFGGLGGGHYTAYAKNLIDGKWYNLDDSSVTPVDKDACKTKAAYVLFYTRRKKKNKVHVPKDYE